MNEVAPVRMVLQYRERPFQRIPDIIQAFFEWRGIQPTGDYFLHICFNSPSTKVYLVLDVYFKTCPDVDLSHLKLEAFRVLRNNTLRVVSISIALLN